MKKDQIYRVFAVVASLATTVSIAQAQQVSLEVVVTNMAPSSGVGLSPFWGGFHDGSFDSYDGGAPAHSALEALAEEGSTTEISQAFVDGGTLIGSASPQTAGERVDFTAPSPLGPGGQSFTRRIQIVDDGAHRYFSYAVMVLPSSDYYVANGNPILHDLTDLFNGGVGSSMTIDIGAPGTVNDAGTEEDDFSTSVGNQFAFAGMPATPNSGVDENGVNTNIAGDPYAHFANNPGGLSPNLNFNDISLYPNGIARITLTVVPEPGMASLFLGCFGPVVVNFLRRPRK